MITKLNKIISLALLTSSLMLASGCAPRGETQNMNDLLAQARDRLRVAEQGAASSPAKQQVAQVVEKLGAIEKVQDPAVLKPATLELSALLSDLMPRAGYTVRPSFAEISAQYRELGNGAPVTTDSSKPGAPEIRLLLVRTYSLLASELETGKFSF
jgi:hypothetical protein